jgi:hypothetical protein
MCTQPATSVWQLQYLHVALQDAGRCIGPKDVLEQLHFGRNALHCDTTMARNLFLKKGERYKGEARPTTLMHNLDLLVKQSASKGININLKF